MNRWGNSLAVLMICLLSSGNILAGEGAVHVRRPILIKGLRTITLDDSADLTARQDLSGTGIETGTAATHPLPASRAVMTATTLPDPASPPQSSGSTQQAAPPITLSPGSDSADYVPGTTVEQFRSMRSFQLGKVLIRPSARLGYYYESNLVSSPAPDVAVHAVVVEPTVEAFIPITGNGIRMDYTLAFRDFDGYELRNRVSHHANADSQINLTPIVNLSIREHFALSTLDSFEFVPGRELIFADAQFRRNSLGTQLNWELSDNNSLGLKADWNHVAFDEVASSGVLPFYDYDQYNFGGFFRRDISQRTGLFVTGTYLRDVTDDPRNLTTSKGFESTVGLDSQITPLTSGQISVGFRRLRYQNSREQDFNGAILRGSLQKELTQTIRVGVSGSRSTNLSNFERNSYYLTHGIGVSYQQELRSNLLVAVMPGYQRNSYPSTLLPRPGITAGERIDRIFDLTIAARYRLNELLGFEARYDLIDRDSNLPELRFRNYRAGVSLLIGQRGIARGRTPY